jgi:hypothetical protein
MRVLRPEVPVYNVYITNQFQKLTPLVEMTRIARRKTLKTFVPITSKNSAPAAIYELYSLLVLNFVTAMKNLVLTPKGGYRAGKVSCELFPTNHLLSKASKPGYDTPL